MIMPVIALIDMDCFYVQVEQRDCPHLKGKPCVVTQYNPYLGGGIIAVNYEARAFGIKRGMRGEEAKQLCSDLHCFSVEEKNGKAILDKYRSASDEIFQLLYDSLNHVERASIDEAFIDLTDEVLEMVRSGQVLLLEKTDLPSTFVYSSSDNEESLESCLARVKCEPNEESIELRLLLAAKRIEKVRSLIERNTGFTCSAGISISKTLAKLCCGFNKPNRQTLLMPAAFDRVLKNISITKLRNLGGKFGHTVKSVLNVESIGEIRAFSKEQPTSILGIKNGTWLYNVVRGSDHDPVNERRLNKSISASKNFSKFDSLDTDEKLRHWLLILVKELLRRLNDDRKTNKRLARILTVGGGTEKTFSFTRNVKMTFYDENAVFQEAYKQLKQFNESKNPSIWFPPILRLFVVGSQFEADSMNMSLITDFYMKNSKNRNIALSQNKQLQEGDSMMNDCPSTSDSIVEDSLAPNEPCSSLNNDDFSSGNVISSFKTFSKRKSEDETGFLSNKRAAKSELSLNDLKQSKTSIGKGNKTTTETVRKKFDFESFLTNNDDTSVRRCERCSDFVSENKYSEHLDYHAALDLDAELRKQQDTRKESDQKKANMRKESFLDKFIIKNS